MINQDAEPNARNKSYILSYHETPESSARDKSKILLRLCYHKTQNPVPATKLGWAGLGWACLVNVYHKTPVTSPTLVSCVAEVRFVAREKGYNLFRALGSVSCDITHETKGVRFVSMSRTTQEARFVTGIGFCVL